MRGLRQRNDPEDYWDSKEGKGLIKYMHLVQSEAKKQNSVFFLDCPTGNELSKDETLYVEARGWLIPEDLSNDFEKIWFEGNEAVGKEWLDYIRWAEWKQKPDGTIEVQINNY